MTDDAISGSGMQDSSLRTDGGEKGRLSSHGMDGSGRGVATQDEWERAFPAGSSGDGIPRGRALSSLSGVEVAGVEALVLTPHQKDATAYNLSETEVSGQ